MALITKPDFTYVWASGGAVVAPNDVKKQLGWIAEAPPFQYDNWLQNRQDQMLAHINQRGIAAWDALTNYEASSLSYVQGSDGKVYKSVAASGPSSVVSNPTTDDTDTYWTIAFAAEKLNAPIVTVAAAGTIDLTTGAPNTSQLAISGTGASINGFTVAASRFFIVKMTGASNTLVNSASLVTGRGANIPVVAGDSFLMRSTGSNTVEIVGGDFLVDRGIGSNQTWQNMTASRAAGVTYTNSAGRPITVSACGDTANPLQDISIKCNGVDIARVHNNNNTGGVGATVQVIIPNGSTYLVDSTVPIVLWMELR